MVGPDPIFQVDYGEQTRNEWIARLEGYTNLKNRLAKYQIVLGFIFGMV